LSALWFTSQNVGYTNINQRIYKTQNGGQTWTEQDIVPEPSGSIRRIAFANENIGFALGTDGIYRTTNGGGLETDSFSGNHLKIYPNPASEKINIEYDNSLNIQKIRLLDLSGRVIKLYKKDYKSLDVSDIHNGEYILNIITNKETITKKILIKN
ncbi:MAG: T9SS type A sorting domain-containing protein, partial [Flavobacteriaceae bacterium]